MAQGHLPLKSWEETQGQTWDKLEVLHLPHGLRALEGSAMKNMRNMLGTFMLTSVRNWTEKMILNHVLPQVTLNLQCNV